MISQDTSRRDFFFVVCASMFWGTVGLANQILYNGYATNALSLAFLRLAIATPFFALALGRSSGLRSIKLRDLGIMLFMGGLQALYQFSYNAALPTAGVTIATLVAICVAPIIVVLFSSFILREHPSLMTLVALGGALAGTGLLVLSQPHPEAGNASLIGVCFALISASGYAGFILCGRLLTHKYHPLQISTIAFGTGALLLLPVAFSTGLMLSYSASGWLLLLYLGCIPTAFAYGLFQIGMRSLSATVVSIVTLFEPLTAAILAWIFLREELGPLGLLGAGLLLGAMTMIMLFQQGGKRNKQ